MAYDEGLAERIRSILDDQHGVTEKKMFGGLAFLVDGKMCCGIIQDELMARVSADGYDAALKRSHARPMEFTGRPMKGFVIVNQDGLELDRELEAWIIEGVACAKAAQAKPKRHMKSKRTKK